MATRPAVPSDVPAIAAIFGRAFDDYQRAFRIDATALAGFWEASLAARIESTVVAEGEGGATVGFTVFVRPGKSERFDRRAASRRETRLLRSPSYLLNLWRPAAFFIPMGLAYTRRPARKDELYISLLAVDPAHQGRGVGQALLHAAEAEARSRGASAILLHTASNNTRARASYARAGFELVCTVRSPWRGPANIPAFVALRKPLTPQPARILDTLPPIGPIAAS